MTDFLEPDFTPAVTRRRIAGWTPARQAAFIAALAGGHSVGVAAASVGLSPRSAYHLRRAADGGEFAEAWDLALQAGAAVLSETAIGRALEGELQPIIYRGQIVGERLVHNDRLLMFLLDRMKFKTRRKSVAR